MPSRPLAAALAVLLLAGCSSAKPRYYTLQAPSPAASSGVADSAQPAVLVGPVNLPEAVDRSQFVLRTGANTVDISDAHRWAEPLKSQIARVLIAQLSQQLGERRVAALGMSAVGEQDLRVMLDIQSFESSLTDGAAIEVRWTLSRAKGKAVNGRSVAREALDGEGYQALAAAHGRALARISRDIAAAVRQAGQ